MFRTVANSKAFGSRNASSLEVAFLALMMFSLPLFEAPKNVFSFAFLLVWIFQSLRSKAAGALCTFSWPIFGLALVLWIGPLFSEYGDVITPLNSAPRWTFVALTVIFASQLNFDRSSLQFIWVALILGGIVAVVESFWVWGLNGKEFPEFRSVGHVNHSSMYTLVTFAAGLGLLYARQALLRVLGAVAAISTLAFLPPSKSIVGGGAIIAVLGVSLCIYFWRRFGVQSIAISTAASLLVVSGVLLTPFGDEFRSEIALRLTGYHFFSGRDYILYSALAVWDKHALLGTGWFSFGMATSEEAVRAALEGDGMAYDPNVYWHFPHGHNLWTTMLIERGLVGVALVTILLFLYFRTFLPIALSREQLDPLDRGAAMGALLVAVGFAVAGLGNTTMMNEHGQAGMAFIAVVYGYLRGRGIIHSSHGQSQP